MPVFFFFQISCYLTCFPPEKVKKNVSVAFDTPNIKWVKCVIFGKIGHGPQLMPAPAFLKIFPNLTFFSRKSDKNRGFLHISPLYIKVGQILGLSKMGHGS